MISAKTRKVTTWTWVLLFGALFFSMTTLIILSSQLHDIPRGKLDADADSAPFLRKHVERVTLGPSADDQRRAEMLRTIDIAVEEGIPVKVVKPVKPGNVVQSNTASTLSAATTETEILVISEVVTEMPKVAVKKGIDARRDEVKEMFLHAWNGYVRCAWGKDELEPSSCSGKNSFGLGLMILDSLSTLWIMDLKDEFQKGREWVAQNLNTSPNVDVSVFETTIRCLGGLLSAYELSKDKLFLDKAQSLGDTLLHAFGPTGLPWPMMNLATKRGSAPGWHAGAAILAEFGTLQLEFTTLAYHTGDLKYATPVLDLVDRLIDIGGRGGVPEGLWSNHFAFSSPLQPKGSSVSMGALGDSTYEYLLKLWLMGGRQHTRLQNAYEKTARAMVKHMRQTTRDGLAYVSELHGSSPAKRMDHLACFSGGMLAMGAASGVHRVQAEEEASRSFGAEIAATCVEMYRRQASGLAPEAVSFASGVMSTPGSARYYLSRPETVETLMYHYRLTEDSKYRDMGEEIYKAINAHTRAANGFAGVRDVTQNPPPLDNLMQTFIMAETFKYLYLLYSDPAEIALDAYVFNTEAHPLGLMTDETNVVMEEMRKRFS